MQVNDKNHFIITVTLMVTIMIDIMGIGLVFPVLPSLLFSEHYAIVSPEMSLDTRHFYFGIVMAVWPLGLLIGSPYFGDLSDKLGRKQIILICLLGVLVSNVLSGYSIHLHALWMFIIGRFFSGFFGGSFPIAQAMMVDISDEKNKSKNISLVTLASSSGFVLGPLITSVSTLPALQALFSYAMPFYVAALVTFLNCLSVIFFLPNITPSNTAIKAHLLQGLLIIWEIFLDKRIRKMLVGFCLLMIGWGFYCMNLAFLMQNVFYYSTSKIALLFAFTAVSNVVGILYLQPRMLKQFSLKQCCLYTSLALVILLLLSANTRWAGMQWIVGAIAPGTQMVFYTAIITLFSNAVSPREQGRVMGGVDAVASLSWMINSFAVGIVTEFSILLPLILGAISILLSTIFFTRFIRLTGNEGNATESCSG